MGKLDTKYVDEKFIALLLTIYTIVGSQQDTFSPEEKERKRGIELNNGRAAMMGILALMVHEELNNDPYVINSLLGYPVDFNAGF